MVLGEKHGTNYLPCTPFQKFSVEIFIHGKKECLRIPDHPVCHRCPGDRHAILFPLLFLTAVGQSVTELLVHHPGNRSGSLGSDPMKYRYCFCGTARTCTRSKENRYSKRIRYMHFSRNSANDPY